MKPVAATIVAKDTLAHARVTATSFRQRHPDLPFYALLADELEPGLFDPAAEPFTLITFPQLGLANPRSWSFRYAQPDLSYALVARFLRLLLDRGYDRVLYLKQESLVVGDLGPLFERLSTAPILLTPHLLSPLALAGGEPRERNVLLAGVFNAGVVGVADSPTGRSFLSWWERRLERHCLRAVGDGFHYEQRWLDLVPSFFAGVAIERDPGANVGHWSHPERTIGRRGEQFLVDGRPLRVARFSGYEPDRPDDLSRHADPHRLRVGELEGDAQLLFERYRRALAAADHATTRRWPVAWRAFDDGVEISTVVRAVYRHLPDVEAATFGDPFRSGAGSYRAWLGQLDRGVPQLWHQLWRRRMDLQAAFPDPRRRDRKAFLRWIETYGHAEHGEDPLVALATG